MRLDHLLSKENNQSEIWLDMSYGQACLVGVNDSLFNLEGIRKPSH